MGVRAYSWFKALVFALLAWNTAVFVHSGTLSEGIDSVAWLALLALFELETGGAPALQRRTTIIRGVRLAAATAIPVAAAGYVLEGEWLDAINSVLWIAVALTVISGVDYFYRFFLHTNPKDLVKDRERWP